MKTYVIGYNHYNTLNVLRAIGKEGIPIALILVSPEGKSFVARSRYVSECHYVADEDEALGLLMELSSKSEDRFPVITCGDRIAAGLDRKYDELSRYCVLPTVGKKQGQLVTAMDKCRQIQMAREAGLLVPETHDIPKGVLKEDFPLRWPCLVKPRYSYIGGKDDFRVFYSYEEFSEWLSDGSSRHENMIMQEFLPNDEVLLIAGVRALSGVNHIAGMITKTKHGSKFNNLGLNSFGSLSPEVEIKTICDRLLAGLDYYGLYSIELLRVRDADGKAGYYFMEINLRSDGLLFFYDKAGVNYSRAWVETCLGKPVSPLKMNKDIVYGMNEFQYLKNFVNRKSLVSAFRDFRKADAFSIFSPSDIMPFFYKFIYK